jgi:hypothetical protein
MSEAFTPLGPRETIAAADRIFDLVDKSLTVRRGLERATDRELLSIVIYVRQLDAIAKAAARYSIRGTDMFAWSELQQLLLVPGYLPLPQNQEPPHGQG